MPRLNIRFSLLNLLFLTTILALSIAHWKLNKQISPLREQLRMLRSETGRLFVQDDSKLQAIQRKVYDDLTWRWRVHVPLGKNYRLKWKFNEIASEGFPAKVHSSNLEAGEWMLTIALRRGEQRRTEEKDSGQGKSEWRLVAESASGASARANFSGITVSKNEWPNERGVGSSSGGVGFSQQSEDAQQRLELLRHRIDTKANLNPIQTDDTPGLLVWIEPTAPK